MGLLSQTSEQYYSGDTTGGYRFISLNDIVLNFMFAYTGEGTLLPHADRSKVIFHAKRGLQEMSYDISKVNKIYEIEVPSSLSIAMPQDYIDRVNIFWIDSSGVQHPVYETDLSTTPSVVPLQDDAYDIIYDQDGDMIEGSSLTNERFKSFDVDSISGNIDAGDYFVANDFDSARRVTQGGRTGLDPQYSNKNGFYMIDEANGKISFSSDMNGRVVVVHYISDRLATDAEMKLHKYEEEAIYQHIHHAFLSTMSNVPEYHVKRTKKDRDVAKRKAKIRLTNFNMRELTQIMRGQSKVIK